MNSELDYKKIIDLIDFKFCIPSYQRGYRWDDNNIIKFIEDIYDDKASLIKKILANNSLNKKLEKVKEDFKNDIEYCIQPLIVKKENETWNIIDGQQRLTTIFIMIAVLNSYETDISGEFKLSISYKSRAMSKEFLEFLLKMTKINDSTSIWEKFKEAKGEIEKNIDFDYMENAFHTIDKCFKNYLKQNKIEENKESFSCLLFILLYFCKFIWYPVDSDDKDEREQFAKINMGKIELTDAELIKAEFMNPNNYCDENINQVKIRQTIISESWYAIETELHKPDFWAFIPHENQYEENDKYKTRIDILFHFVLLENWIEKNKDKGIDEYINENGMKFNEEHFLFYEIKKWIDEEEKNKNLNKNEIIEACWERIVDIFQNLKELYEDDGRELEWKINNSNNNSRKKYTNEQGLYNLIGFLIYSYNSQKDNKKFITGKENNVDKSITKALKIYYEIHNILKEERCNRINIIKQKINNLVFSINVNREKESIQSIIKKMEYEGLYGDKIAIVLLLYNIILVNKSTGIGNRYNFLQHAKENWSKEHIFPQVAKEFINDKNERKEVLKVLIKGVRNKVIVIKSSPLLNYINYKYDKVYSPIDGLKNKGIIELNEKIVDDFLKEKNEVDVQSGNIENMYRMEYAKSLYLIKKSQEILEMYDILEENQVCFDENLLRDKMGKSNNDNKMNYIFKYKDVIIDYDKDILISNLLESEINKADHKIYIYLINKKMKDFFEMLSAKMGIIKNEKYERINIKIEEYYEYILNIEIENSDLFKQNKSEKAGQIIEEIKQIIKEVYDDKIKEITIYDIDIKNKIYKLIVKYKDLDEIKKVIDSDKFPELKISNTIDEIIKKMDNNNSNSKFLDLVIKISSDTIKKKIDDFFKYEYLELLNDNSMGNMTLLDAKTNGDSKIGNKPYNIKKERIYSKMKKGVFIPLSTMLVFTDLYTKSMGIKIHWLPESRVEYLNDMVNTICDFFGEKVNKR
ncbi:DUF262 domain-containing protein [Clostridium botulinum]|nr:DUF262 domain-containing protein [Clostridium botulinum]